MKKTKKKILVVMGGDSRERAVSLETGNACIKSLKRQGYIVQKFDPLKKFYGEIKKLKVDVIFNALHGKNGEDGNAQSYFEHLRIPYTHSGALSSMRAMDKVISKNIFKKHKLLTPKFFVLNTSNFALKKLRQLQG